MYELRLGWSVSHMSIQITKCLSEYLEILDFDSNSKILKKKLNVVWLKHPNF